MAIQSNDEVLRIWDEWSRNFAPAGLVLNEKNAVALCKHLGVVNGGVVSISGLTDAVKAIAGQLDWVKQKTQKELFIEAQQKEKERNRRDQLENQPKPAEYIPPTKNFSPAEVARRVEKDKKDESALKQARAVIASYTPTCSSGVDHGEREAAQKEWNQKLQNALAFLKKNPDWDFTAWVGGLADLRDARYAARERARERM